MLTAIQAISLRRGLCTNTSRYNESASSESRFSAREWSSYKVHRVQETGKSPISGEPLSIDDLVQVKSDQVRLMSTKNAPRLLVVVSDGAATLDKLQALCRR